MKRLTVLVAALLMVGGAMAQQQQEPKKKGSFWDKVKKGVESTTGINVSKETLFVYPELGRWKMELKSAKADSVTGVMKVIIKVMPLGGDASARFRMMGVVGEDGKSLVSGTQWEEGSNGYDLAPAGFTEVEFRKIMPPQGMAWLKSLKFNVGNIEGFEVRDVPIEWGRLDQ